MAGPLPRFGPVHYLHGKTGRRRTMNGRAQIYSPVGHEVQSMSRKQKGFSLIELLIVVAIILVIAAIAIPSLLRSKLNANEASAVHSLRALNTACTNYASTYGGGYPAAISNLGPAVVPSAGAGGVVNTYTITADPTSRGNTGQRGFFTDQTFVIRANSTGTASATDPPIS